MSGGEGAASSDHDALKALELQARHSRGNKDRYAFWETQPVAQFSDGGSGRKDGPIDAPKTPQDVRQEPWALPAPFDWKDCDLTDDETLHQVYELLTKNYVEDDDNMFRFDYSPAFLRWAMCPPGWRKDWLIGVMDSRTGKLFAFISAIPATLRVRDAEMRVAEVNFLCVHKKLRSRRLAPVLIKEITRRVNLCDMWQAVYTAGVVIPKPVGTGRYYHRSLDPKKLIEVQFSRLSRNMTMARTIKLNKLPETTATPGLREMRREDVPTVVQLLKTYLAKFSLAPALSKEDVEHWVLPRGGVVSTYVAEVAGEVRDVVSFYSLPSTVLGNEQHKTLRAAYMFYTCANTVPLQQLMQDALILAKNAGFDVFNALDIMDNQTFLKELKFGIGDGSLHYYLYNWYVAGRAKDGPPLQPSDIGLVML